MKATIITNSLTLSTFALTSFVRAQLPIPADSSGVFNGDTIEYFDLPTTFEDAQSICVQRGGHLARITSLEQSDEFFGIASQAELTDFWIGIDALNDVFDPLTPPVLRYTDGSTEFLDFLDVAPWDEGEPFHDNQIEEACVEFSAQDIVWRTTSCSNQRAFLCRIPPVPDLTGQIGLDKLDFFQTNRKDFAEARATCQSLGGDIARVTDINEYNIVVALNPDVRMWIGVDSRNDENLVATDQGRFSFTDGFPDRSFILDQGPIPWVAGEPNNVAGDEFCVE